MIGRQIEEGFEVIAAVDPERRGIVARNWPHLLPKLRPEEDCAAASMAREQPTARPARSPRLRRSRSGQPGSCSRAAPGGYANDDPYPAQPRRLLLHPMMACLHPMMACLWLSAAMP